jgi:hypothetical protein
MRKERSSELERVLERGFDIDQSLLNECAYYPLFRYVDFYDKKTDEHIKGQQLVCKDCNITEPNARCKHYSTLLW